MIILVCSWPCDWRLRAHTEGEMNLTLREEARQHFGRACRMGGVCAGIVENAVYCMCYSRTSALQWLTSMLMKMCQQWRRSYFDVRDMQPSTEPNSLQLQTKKVPWGWLGQELPCRQWGSHRMPLGITAACLLVDLEIVPRLNSSDWVTSLLILARM